jgi:hypothetical protein
MTKGDIVDKLGWFSLMSTLEANLVVNSSIPNSMIKGLPFD